MAETDQTTTANFASPVIALEGPDSAANVQENGLPSVLVVETPALSPIAEAKGTLATLSSPISPVSPHSLTYHASIRSVKGAPGDNDEKGGAAGDSRVKSSSPSIQETEPKAPRTVPEMTQYVDMLLELDKAPATHSIAAAFFNWVYLAGFILFPSTFAKLANFGKDHQHELVGGLATAIAKALPLYAVAWACVGIGISGLALLWLRWRKNHLWVLNKIWTPALLNSLAGLLATLSSIFVANDGKMTSSSQITLIVIGASATFFALMMLIYLLWLVRGVKKKHERQMSCKV